MTVVAPANNGFAITGYQVTPYKAGVAQAVQSFGSGTTFALTGLTNGASYTFKVAAVNAKGTGAQSSSSAVVQVGAVPSAPGRPAAAPGNARATVSWTAPGLVNGFPVTGYTVTVIQDGVVLRTTTFASAATSQVITGLTNGRLYSFKVLR